MRAPRSSLSTTVTKQLATDVARLAELVGYPVPTVIRAAVKMVVAIADEKPPDVLKRFVSKHGVEAPQHHGLTGEVTRRR